MSDPGFARPDLCSIRAADEQEELAEAVRSGFSADGCPLGDDDPPAPLTSGIDRAIRLSTARGRARRGGHRGLCLLLARLRGRPGARRDRDHRPAGAGHDRRPGLRQFDGRPVRGTAPGAGTRPWPAGCSGWGSRPPSPRTWPRAGPTAPSGRWSRPGRRSASWAPMSFLQGVLSLSHDVAWTGQFAGSAACLCGCSACS